jgi:hypothetical protein
MFRMVYGLQQGESQADFLFFLNRVLKKPCFENLTLKIIGVFA